jgi:hypothetical protein
VSPRYRFRFSDKLHFHRKGVPMAFTIEGFFSLAATLFKNTTVLESGPVATGRFGGSVLKKFSKDSPDGQDIGFVIACPNVPRPWHSGFDPDSPERTRFRGDFFDKIVYVSMEDYNASEQSQALVDIFTITTALLRKAFDNVDADGCSPGSCHTYLQRVNISSDGTAVTFAKDLEGPYAVLAASFLPENASGATGPMSVSQFWIAAHEDRDMILSTPQHDEAVRLSDRVRTTMITAPRRPVVRRHLRDLRGAFNADPYDDR